MNLVTIDFETYWDVEYSLTKQNVIEYVHDDRFEVICCGIKKGDRPTEVVWQQEEVAKALKQIDWEHTAVIAHNGNEFDFPILVWKFHCHPALFIDTKAIAAPRRQSLGSLSLAALSEVYDLPSKQTEKLQATRGKRYADITLRETYDLTEYNVVDTDNCYALAKIFLDSTPKSELLLSDLTARMLCYPQFVVDTALLDKTLDRVKAAKQDVLASVCRILGVSHIDDAKAALMSNQKFASILQEFGVEPPTKISVRTGKPTFALARTDQEFIALGEHEDERVQALVAARVDTKSTILETRLAAIRKAASFFEGNKLPVPLAYHAATTGRWGGRIYNCQNLPRVERDKQGKPTDKASNALRLSLCAPPGHKVVVADLSAIELRVNHFLWGENETQAAFEKNPKADLYIDFASVLYNKRPEDVTDGERQIAKIAQLGLGYGAGAATFRRIAKAMGGVNITEDESEWVVRKWRDRYARIVMGWTRCQKAIVAMLRGIPFSVDPLDLVRVEQTNELVLPSGRRLYYPNLAMTVQYDNNLSKDVTKITYGVGTYGGVLRGSLLTENIVQAISRDILSWHMLSVFSLTKRYPALHVHDELVYVVPEDEAQQFQHTLDRVMRTSPPWIAGLILYSKSSIAERYGDAK